MKLTALRLHNVKRFGGRGVAIENIGDGVNVLCAANEYGKSTCFEALHAIFFQPHTGVPKSVRQMQPYSGGNPLVEVDIATAEGRYRLTKQFIGGKRASVTDLGTGRLVAQADEAEAFIGELIRGGVAGPAGLLWVRQGLTGIEERSKSEQESEKRVRESLLSSVQGEVEALTGGRRMTEILAACEEELDRLVTSRLKPKKGGDYDKAIEERDRLLNEEQRLGAEVTVLRDALDKRRLALTRLVELENPDEEAVRRAYVVAAEAAYTSAKSHSETLKTAEAEAALSANHRETAWQALGAYQDALTQAAELRLALAAAGRRRDDIITRREAAIRDNDAAMAAIQSAEQDERAARDLFARLDGALRARDAADKLGEAHDRLAQAEAARAQVEDSEAALAIHAIPADAVDRLQALEIDIAQLRATQQASLPTLRMSYLEGASGAVTLDAESLREGEDRSFADTVRLDIAGIGALTLRSNRPPQADQALEQAEHDHRSLMAALGVDSLAAARERQRVARDIAAGLELARQRLGDLAPKGIARLHEEIARLTELSAGVLACEATDPEQVRQQLALAEARVATTRNSLREIGPLLGQIANALVQAETAYASTAAELAAREAILGVAVERADKERALTAAYAASSARYEEAENCAAALRGGAHDLAGAEAALRRAKSVQEAASQEAGQLRVKLADLNGHIRTRSDDAVEEAWQESIDSLAAAAERVKRFEIEVATLDRLRQALASARSTARDLYLKPVISELRPLLGLLFDDISIVFDETTLLPQSVRRNGQDEEVERLSGGMREQLSVLTRLAFARLLARDGRPAPVILDDALVYSDDDRIERMFDALHRQSRDQQILVFSCRQRAFARLGGNVLQMQAWTPQDA